jgi:hypothetical protein
MTGILNRQAGCGNNVSPEDLGADSINTTKAEQSRS